MPCDSKKARAACVALRTFWHPFAPYRVRVTYYWTYYFCPLCLARRAHEREEREERVKVKRNRLVKNGRKKIGEKGKNPLP